MDRLQQQARALGDPSRHAIHRFVADAGRPVGVADVAARFPLSTNTVRLHLATLRDAGLLTERTVATGRRGRPALSYTATPGALGGPNPYQQLARLLLELHRSGRTATDVGRDAGLADGNAVRDQAADPVAGVVAVLATAGFDPSAAEREAEVDIEIRSCPFADAVTVDAATVCDLHRGLADGVASALGGIEVVDLDPHDPHHAGCHLRLRRSPDPKESTCP